MRKFAYGIQKPREDRVDLTEAYWQKFIPIVWKTLASKQKALAQLLLLKRNSFIEDKELLELKIKCLRQSIKEAK